MLVKLKKRLINLIPIRSIRKKLRNRINLETSFLKFKKICKELETENISLVSNSNKRKNKITISLTSYGERVKNLHFVIKNLAHQSMKADRIVLWLDEAEFSDKTISKELKNLEKLGLEIGYCENIKAYKKLIPTLQKYPQDLIITVDDDMIYPNYLVEDLYKAWNKNKKIVFCFRGNYMLYKNKELISYLDWKAGSSNIGISKDIFPTGMGGVLYFPGCFYDLILEKKVFMSLAPFGDDIWFKAMTLKNNVKCCVLPTRNKFEEDFFEIPGSQNIALWHVNIVENKNDSQIKDTFEYLGLLKK